jgi:hypothetical protein
MPVNRRSEDARVWDKLVLSLSINLLVSKFDN